MGYIEPKRGIDPGDKARRSPRGRSPPLVGG
jgi:hypothetical protein